MFRTIRIKPIMALLVLSALGVPPMAAATFQGLGDLAGGGFGSWACGVSADGSVVVGHSLFSEFWREAFRWTSSTGMVGLGNLDEGERSSYARGVSADGSVVVGWGYNSSRGGAYAWTASGGMVDLGDLAGGSFSSSASGVSADGSVVVGTGESQSGTEAFRWTASGGMAGLGCLPGPTFYSTAAGVSADGSVVVGCSQSRYGPQAYRWTDSSGMVGLGYLSTWGGSNAEAVSADGSVVVGRAVSDASWAYTSTEAFLWTASGGMVGLGDLPGGDFSSQANGVSGDGSVIVGYATTATGMTAFVWDVTSGMRDLQQVLGPAVPAGWSIASASAVTVNNSIATIVGSGINPSGDSEAWIATVAVPEPSGLLALGTGLVTVAGLLRRRKPTRRQL